MATKQHDWACWSELRVGDPAAQYAFWETLAKRQGWTVAFAEHVFTEYRKFLYVVPADRKSTRNLLVAKVVVDTLARMAPKFPKVNPEVLKIARRWERNQASIE